MKCNIGKKERTVRVVAGLVLLVLGLVFQTWWGLIGIFPLITGFKGWCPPYQWLGINTNKGDGGEKAEKK